MTGRLHLVSVGPGEAGLIPPQAIAALEASEIIVGYELYLRWIQPWIEGKEIHSPPLTQERERAQMAVDAARAGQQVALVSSGDIGIYAMATLAFELMREDDTFEVQVVPGISAANACAALLGAPLSHDFATLSLSDLLCPWDWIEQRARHIAEADLALVLYNVQSRQRQQGVYRILEILQAHKRPQTLCGIVRNAYRPEQSVEICTLAELPSRPFDMLTTLVIGNRFTRQKRGWIYTPRGYGDWDDAQAPAHREDLPAQALWVFSGTRDGNALARQLADQGHHVLVSTASAYGAAQLRQDYPDLPLVSGRMGLERRRQLLTTCQARAIIDATHPYATDMSRQLMQLADELNLPYLRFERPDTPLPASAIICDSMAQAAERAINTGRRIFLASGSKDLPGILNSPGAGQCDWFLRLPPDPVQVERALALGIPQDHICAMQGPFSQTFNESLWRDWGIDCVISKASGVAGGFPAKAAAAEALGIPLIVIRRPVLEYPVLAGNPEALLMQLQNLGLSA